MSEILNKRSKALSFWLRHRPDAGNLELDANGWADVSQILSALGNANLATEFPLLERVVAESDKQRFELSDDKQRIRARQGHSVKVDAQWVPTQPPTLLFHGTVERFLDAILAEGLKPMKRHHVHLSADIGTAEMVGQRRGKPVVLTVAADEMARRGHEFALSSNGVWLVSAVPPEFLALTDQPG